MPQSVPNGWASDSSLTNLLPSTPQGEVPIKSELTYNGNKYAVITNSKGEYKVFLGGTGILNQQIGESAEVYKSTVSGELDGGIAWSRPDTKTLIGGTAGMSELKSIAERQVSQGLSKYLTADDVNNLQNPGLKSSTQDAIQSQTEPLNFNIVDPNNELFDITAKDFQKDTKFNADYLTYPESLKSTNQNRINITQRRYVSSISALGENNSLFNPRFNQPVIEGQQEFLGTVVLPMPNNISEANSTGWGENSLSTLASQVMNASFGVVKSVGSGDIFGGTQKATDALKNFASDAEKKQYIRQLLTLNAAASVTKFLGINIDPEAYRSRATGTVINPNLELLFNGPKLRSFGFEFKMIPRSEKEATNIRYILKFFKKGMAAKRGTTGEGYFLGAPNVFDIEFKGSEKNIGKIKTCALQTFNVNYTPDGVYAAFKDSQPISVVMQLGFTELTPIYNDNYDESADSVGWDNQN